jgi:hypothetical protein
MPANARCPTNGGGVALLLLLLLGLVVLSTLLIGRDERDEFELIMEGNEADDARDDGGMAGKFARGYYVTNDGTAMQREERRRRARARDVREISSAGDDRTAAVEPRDDERTLKGYRKNGMTRDELDTTTDGATTMEEGETLGEEGTIEDDGGGSNVVDESIAERMTRMQFKLRPTTTDIVLEGRMASMGDLEGGTTTTKTTTTADSPFPYRYPKLRYVPWRDLSGETKDYVTRVFGYNVGSWNYMSSHAIEGMAYSALDKDQRTGLLMLGIDEDVWDCFINRELIIYIR